VIGFSHECLGSGGVNTLTGGPQTVNLEILTGLAQPCPNLHR
jgi:hypothetical protein